MRIKTQQKCNEIINLVNDKQHDTISLSPPSSSENSDHWKEISYKNRCRRQLIIGNNTDVAVKGVPKHVTLHVYRVDLKTSLDDFRNKLIPNFPEAVVEQISTKYPDLYKSFKVTIYKNNFKNAMDPKVWPAGAYVSKFFQIRKSGAPVK